MGRIVKTNPINNIMNIFLFTAISFKSSFIFPPHLKNSELDISPFATVLMVFIRHEWTFLFTMQLLSEPNSSRYIKEIN